MALHHQFIARKIGDQVELVRDFEGMYRTVDDPHGQQLSATNAAHGVYEQLLSRVATLLTAERETPLRYLDAGCGLGHYTDRVVTALRRGGRPVEAVAIDVAPAAVSQAARHASQPIEFAVASLTQPSDLGALGVFDLVTCFETLYYFTEAEIDRVVANLSGLVARGGFLALSYHLPEQMGYGRYIRGLADVARLFAEFRAVWQMDFVDNLSVTYDGSPFGRHLFVVLQKHS